MVLPACLSSHYKRHFCIHLRNDMGKDSPYPVISEKDCRGIHWRMDLHRHHWRRNSLLSLQVQIYDLSCHCNFPNSLLLMYRISGFQLGRVWIVNPIPFSSPASSKSHRRLSHRLENFFQSQIQSPSLQSSFISSFLRHLHLSSLHSAASLQVVSNELSKSKISGTVSLDTAA